MVKLIMVANIINNTNKKQRNVMIDFLKGVSIIAVVLYHFGGELLPFGYLGVDVFFVISGYFLVKGLLKRFQNNDFNYWSFVFRKFVRLWPLVIIVAIVSISLGYFVMLPDDYENLSETTIASSFFANNILQCITTENYWDVVNLYKPLMHLWYVGVLMQAYIIIPLYAMIIHKITKAKGVIMGLRITTLSLTLISFGLYLIPTFTTAQKFYYLPFRIFEIMAAGLVVLWKPQMGKKATALVGVISLFIIIFILSARVEIVSKSFMLILIVVLTVLAIDCTEEYQLKGIIRMIVVAGSEIGKRSYSVYIWHQMIISFMFYSFFSKHSIVQLLILILIVTILALISYKYIEGKLGRIISYKKKESAVLVITGIFSFIVCGFAFLIYCNSGVVRDVPELNIYQNKVHKGMHKEYTDRPYSWNNDFDNNRKINVLVLGNSFGRDFANILYEWDTKKELQVSYVYYESKTINKYRSRIESADYIFYATGPEYLKIPSAIKESVPDDKLYIVSDKNYGESNGIIYFQRLSENYFNQTVEIDQELIDYNESLKREYGDHFIDLMKPVLVDNNAKVFTDEKKFISQDCRHLTQAGAQFYAKILNLGSIFDKKQ